MAQKKRRNKHNSAKRNQEADQQKLNLATDDSAVDGFFSEGKEGSKDDKAQAHVAVAKAAKAKEPKQPVDKDKAKAAAKKAKAKAKDDKQQAKLAARKDKKPNVFRRILNYFKGVKGEIKRTTWPTKHEVWNMTIIVLVALLFFGILIFLLDQLMVVILNAVTNLIPSAS
jgi:preprotein translocase subunit SecE